MSKEDKPIGRPKKFWHVMQIRFPRGMFEAIAAVLRKDETRTHFIRDAASRELSRRNRSKTKKEDANG